MARASQVTQKISRAGLAPEMTQPTADGDVIDAGAVFLFLSNGSGSPVTVTVVTPATVDGMAVADVVVTVPADDERMIGPFPARTFAQPSGSADVGRVYVNYSAQTSVTRAVLAL